MRKLFLLAVITIFCQNLLLNAQRLDRETFGVYKYTQLPINIILTPFQTYRVEGEGQYSDAYRRDAVIRATNIEGYKKMNEGADADFVVKVEEYPLKWAESEMKKTTEKVKKDGIETSVTKYYYRQDVSYKYVLKIYNRTGENIYSRVNSGEDHISTKQYLSSSDAYNELEDERNEFSNKIIGSAVGSLCNAVNDEVGFPIKSLYLKTANIKPKKFTYEEYDKSIELFKKGIDTILADENNIEAARAYFNPAIEIWAKMISEANLEDNKARIDKDIATVCYLNIALCYTMLKDYEKAIGYYTKGQELDKNFCSMDEGMKMAQDCLNRVKANETK